MAYVTVGTIILLADVHCFFKALRILRTNVEDKVDERLVPPRGFECRTKCCLLPAQHGQILPQSVILGELIMKR